jgi:hypothetical protein
VEGECTLGPVAVNLLCFQTRWLAVIAARPTPVTWNACARQQVAGLRCGAARHLR